MDETGLTRIVEEHEESVYRYLKYLGAEHATAEDLVQEVFLVAFRHAQPPPRSETRRVAGWLRGIARNLFLTHCRRTKREPLRWGEEALAAAEATWRAHGGDDPSHLQRTLEAFRACLANLNGRNRLALELRYVERRPRAEIAQRLDLGLEGVKAMLKRIRAALVKCMATRRDAE